MFSWLDKSSSSYWLLPNNGRWWQPNFVQLYLIFRGVFLSCSAVVDITGRMGVSALYAEAGIFVNSSLYTVTQIKGNATYTQGEILKFEVGVPEEPVQFVNVS